MNIGMELKVLAIVLLLFFVQDVRAEPADILADVVPIKQGVCAVKADGTLASEENEIAYTRNCVIGINQEEETMYVVLYDKHGKIETIIAGKSPTTQKVIHRKGEISI